MKFKHLKTFEEISSNDYRNDDPISKLKMMELIYNTIMDTDGEQLSHYKVEDKELDMESSEITFIYDGVPFRLSIEKVDKIKECAMGGGSVPAPGSPNSPALPRKSTVNRIKRLGKKSGKNKSMKSSGGSNALSGKIESNK